MKGERKSGSSVYEIDPNDLELNEKLLGSGNFASVHCGRLKTDHRAESSSKDNFVNEIVRYSGKKRRTVYKSEVDGNWAPLYEQRRAESIVTTSDLLSFAYQIANGMEFLHSKEVVHRDLALRNILLTYNYTVKIGDFGLSRRTINGLYQKCQSPRLPLKWTAPEVFVDDDVPIESDLYTFGILLWELFTLGAMPHEQFTFVEEVEEEEVNFVIKKGKRMNKPPFAPKEIYELMQLLCNLNPDLRLPWKQCKRNVIKNLKEACPPLAFHVDVADGYEKPEKNRTIDPVLSEESKLIPPVTIPWRKDKLPSPLSDDNDKVVLPKAKKHSNCFTKNYRRNIILIFVGVIFSLVAISTVVIVLYMKNSPAEIRSAQFNETPSIIQRDGNISVSETLTSVITTTTTLLPTTNVSQQQPTEHSIPTSTASPTNASTVEERNLCKNNGTLNTGGKCECPHLFTGKFCEDHACVNGLSTGAQYDPDSTFLKTRCLCDSGWSGVLCDTSLVNRCGENGKEENGRCICHENFTGAGCEYVTRCINGQLYNGRCACHYGWSGDFCEQIICKQGHSDETNSTCICPSKYRGKHCDHCVEPFSLPPECAEMSGSKSKSYGNSSCRSSSRLYVVYIASVYALIFRSSHGSPHA
uniref:Uncharacterized protein n=1 Tax=Plectus sambesii TaxID=2011161 RepID=A0A914WW23_9BILA